MRRRALFDAYKATMARSEPCDAETGLAPAALQHPLLHRLHCAAAEADSSDALLAALEPLLTSAEATTLFEQRALAEPPLGARWSLVAHSAGDAWPCARGGHQMCLERATGDLYLFGGWTGTADLNDLWRFDAQARRWHCLDSGSSASGGDGAAPLSDGAPARPSPRSCHKVAFDGVNRRLYTLGRYIEPPDDAVRRRRPPGHLPSRRTGTYARQSRWFGLAGGAGEQRATAATDAPAAAASPAAPDEGNDDEEVAILAEWQRARRQARLRRRTRRLRRLLLGDSQLQTSTSSTDALASQLVESATSLLGEDEEGDYDDEVAIAGEDDGDGGGEEFEEFDFVDAPGTGGGGELASFLFLIVPYF